MAWLRWVAAALATVEGGFMLFDGVRALVTGDYTTPRSGKHAGELGPWADLVSAVGIDPRSTAMKVGFVIYGSAWLAAVAAFAAGRSWAWMAMLAVAIGGLWYVPFGTLISVLVIVILLLAPVRGGLWG